MDWTLETVKACVGKPLTNGLPGRKFIVQSSTLWCVKVWRNSEGERRRSTSIIESSDVGIIADWLTRHGYKECQ